jgi:hypothetical protein
MCGRVGFGAAARKKCVDAQPVNTITVPAGSDPFPEGNRFQWAHGATEQHGNLRPIVRRPSPCLARFAARAHEGLWKHRSQ